MVLITTAMPISSLLRSNYVRPLAIGLVSQALLLSHSNRVKCEATRAASTSADLSRNPLLHQESLPKFREITPIDVVPAIRHDLDKLKHDFSGRFF